MNSAHSTSACYKETPGVARIILEFAGQKVSINQFIRESKDAEVCINLAEKKFCSYLVKSKVTGNAKKCGELKRTYAAPQNLSQIQANLSRVVQIP